MTDNDINWLCPGREMDDLVGELTGYEWFVHAPGVESAHPGKRFLMRGGPWLEPFKGMFAKAGGDEPIAEFPDSGLKDLGWEAKIWSTKVPG